MTHREAAAYLPELLRGELAEELSGDVAEHVASCAECAALSATFFDLKRAVLAARRARIGPHPDSAELVALATEPDALSAERVAAVRRHVITCPECRSDVDAIRWVDAETRPPIVAVQDRGRYRLAALAAAAVVAVLAYPSYLGLVRLPDVEQRLATRTALREPVGGPIAAHELPAPGRGLVAVATVVVDDAHSWTLLRVALPAPSDRTSDRRAELHDPSGAVVRAWSLPAAELPGLTDEVGMLSLLVATSHLRPGRTELRLLRANGDGYELDALIPFVVARPE